MALHHKIEILSKYINDPSANPIPITSLSQDSTSMFFLTYMGEQFLEGYRVMEKIGVQTLILSLMEYQPYLSPSYIESKQSLPQYKVVHILLETDNMDKQSYRIELFKQLKQITDFIDGTVQINILYLKNQKFSVLNVKELQVTRKPQSYPFFKSVDYLPERRGYKQIDAKQEGTKLHAMIEYMVKGAGFIRNMHSFKRSVIGDNCEIKFSYELERVRNTIRLIIGKQIIENSYLIMSSQKWMRKKTQKIYKRFDLILRSQDKTCIIDWKFSKQKAVQKINTRPFLKKNQLYFQLAKKDYRSEVQLKFCCVHIENNLENYHKFTQAKWQYKITQYTIDPVSQEDSEPDEDEVVFYDNEDYMKENQSGSRQLVPRQTIQALRNDFLAGQNQTNKNSKGNNVALQEWKANNGLKFADDVQDRNSVSEPITTRIRPSKPARVRNEINLMEQQERNNEICQILISQSEQEIQKPNLTKNMKRPFLEQAALIQQSQKFPRKLVKQNQVIHQQKMCENNICFIFEQKNDTIVNQSIQIISSQQPNDVQKAIFDKQKNASDQSLLQYVENQIQDVSFSLLDKDQKLIDINVIQRASKEVENQDCILEQDVNNKNMVKIQEIILQDQNEQQNKLNGGRRTLLGSKSLAKQMYFPLKQNNPYLFLNNSLKAQLPNKSSHQQYNHQIISSSSEVLSSSVVQIIQLSSAEQSYQNPQYQNNYTFNFNNNKISESHKVNNRFLNSTKPLLFDPKEVQNNESKHLLLIKSNQKKQQQTKILQNVQQVKENLNKPLIVLSQYRIVNEESMADVDIVHFDIQQEQWINTLKGANQKMVQLQKIPDINHQHYQKPHNDVSQKYSIKQKQKQINYVPIINQRILNRKLDKIHHTLSSNSHDKQIQATFDQLQAVHPKGIVLNSTEVFHYQNIHTNIMPKLTQNDKLSANALKSVPLSAGKVQSNSNSIKLTTFIPNIPKKIRITSSQRRRKRQYDEKQLIVITSSEGQDN